MPDNAILVGNIQSVLIQGKVRSTWSPTRGATTTYIYKGKLDIVIQNGLVLQQSGWETDIEQGPSSTLTATYPEDLLTGNPSNPVPVWTIEPHPIERPLLDCVDRPIIANLSTKTKELIEYSIKNPTTDAPLVASDELSQLANARIAYALMRYGVEGRQEFTIAVKRTLITSRYYNANWALVNNGFVMSKSAVVSTYGVDAATAAFMPDSFGIQTDVNGIDYYWGYLEQKPTRATIANQKVQIEQMWLYNKWSAGNNGLYPAI